MKMSALFTAIAAIAICQNSVNAAEADDFANRVLGVTDVVLKHHIDPPTRQQLILSGAKSLYRSAGKLVPQSLSGKISGLASRKEQTEFLRQTHGTIRGDVKRLEQLFINEMLHSLPGGARWMSSVETKVQSQLSANRYVGTGIVLSMDRAAKRPSIPKPFYDGPAWKAGVKRGDLILKIDGKSTKNMPLSQVVKLLRGEAGTDVRMTVRQPKAKTSRTLTITRGVTFIPTVEGYRQLAEPKWEYRIDAAGHLAYIRINRIGSSTLHELRQVERALRGKKLRGIVLDLQYGGGSLHDTILLADALLDGGTIGRVRNADSIKKHESRKGAMFAGLPMAVLIARHSNSDREFLTAALQDNRRAIVVGETTSGDGFVRRAVPSPIGGYSIVMAIGELQRGDGTPLRSAAAIRMPVRQVRTRHAKTAAQRRPGGIVPDFRVAVTNSQRAKMSRAYAATNPGRRKPIADPVIAKAVERLNVILKRHESTTKNKTQTKLGKAG